MKKILYILVLFSSLLFASCNDELDTKPTNMMGDDEMLETYEGGQAVMNGIYRMMYTYGWGTAWYDENSGIMAYVQAADLMGEDHVMLAAGQGWFWYDYALNVASDYTSAAGRSYQTWNFFYKMIDNANSVISKDSVWERTPQSRNVLGQAYAVRAFAYSNLAQMFQQSYAEGDTLPGVPIYTEPTTKNTKGKPRGYLKDVYVQMNSDIDSSLLLLKDTKASRGHESHIDYYVANGIKARIALAQGVDYQRALDGAKEALSKPSLTPLAVSDFLGWNKKSSANALWALEVIATQSENYRGFFSHMDADATGMYAARARRAIASGLYDLIPSTDDRKEQWWRGLMDPADEESGNSKVSLCQLKFRFGNPSDRTGDYLIMRAEEMLLIAAEAACRLDDYTTARGYLSTLGSYRDKENYAARLATMTDAKTYSTNTLDAPQTLLEEILFQRRVELWGESPRVYDLKRLKLGYNRTYTGSNHAVKRTATRKDVRFVLPIPQAEFDGNTSMDGITDQNPM